MVRALIMLKFVFSLIVFVLSMSLCKVTFSQFIPAADDPVMAMIDSLDVQKFFETTTFTSDREKLNVFRFPPDSVPYYSEDVYRKRIAKLDQLTPFDLEYNQFVKGFIDLYARRKRSITSRMLGLAELYFPLFEEKLAKHNMPLELKYLAIVESALNPLARSRVGASGLWQFMYRTGLLYGLQVNSYVDERCDPELATEAACRYLKYLHSLYGDWNLALAAYNAGPGNVNKGVRRSGGKKTYWEVRPFLPQETQSYVPAFTAAVYVMNYHKEHNIYPVHPKFFNYEIDSVYIHNNVTFQQISSILNFPVEDIRFLNPMYIKDIIPGSFKPYPLYLPKKLIGDFLTNEKNLNTVIEQTVSFKAPADSTSKTTDLPEPLVAPPSSVEKIHIVKKGEYVSSIARKYAVRVSDIMEWNKLKSSTLYVGQKIKVQVPGNTTAQTSIPASASVTDKPVTAQASAKYKYYTVRSGDTLSEISRRYGVSIAYLMKINNLRSKSLKVGARLKIKLV